MVDTTNTDPLESRPGQGAAPASGRKTRTVFSLSEDETHEFGRILSHGLKGGELVLLEGDLGLGKTVFARGIAEGLGVAPEEVSSPSFTLIQEYRDGRLPIYHVDLYRMETVEDVSTLGLDDLLEAGGVTVVEWGDRLPPYYRSQAIIVRFHEVGEGCRRIELIELKQDDQPRRGDA